MIRPGVRSLARRGSRTILQTYPGLRLGNYLYFALHAHREQRSGRDYRVLDSGLGDEWFDLFPNLRTLVIRPRDVRFWDQREFIPPLFFQEFGTDFTREELELFVQTVIAPGMRPHGAPRSPDLRDAGSVTVNVRRGDYYSDAGFRKLFGFDVETYVQNALRAVEAAAPVHSVHLVSDDIPWCQTALGWAVRETDWRIDAGAVGDPVSDFIDLAQSRRLVITNSTFSYWGAYVSATLHGRDHLGVWAPRLHSRAVRAGRPWQHDPTWNAVGVSQRDAVEDGRPL